MYYSAAHWYPTSAYHFIAAHIDAAAASAHQYVAAYLDPASAY